MRKNADLIAEMNSRVKESFDRDEAERARLGEIIDRFPNITPAEIYLAFEVLIWQGKLQVKIH